MTRDAVAAAVLEELDRSGFATSLDNVKAAMGPFIEGRACPDRHKRSKVNLSVRAKQLEAVAKAKKLLEEADLPSDSLSKLEGQAKLRKGLAEFLLRDQLDAKGGTNWPAREVAGMVLMTFIRLGKDITFGVAPGGNHPSTAYGRAVQAALQITDKHANWRNAAHHWVKKISDEEQKRYGAKTRKEILEKEFEAEMKAWRRNG